MYKFVLLAYCGATFAVITISTNVSDNLIKVTKSFQTTSVEHSTKVLIQSNSFIQDRISNSSTDFKFSRNLTSSAVEKNPKFTDESVKTDDVAERKHRLPDVRDRLPFLHKIRARITRSKDAVWATISLTFVCVLLILAVAQSRMWRDHYYVETQGVPLPNFNERVLFKDVMDRKVRSFREFFKKKSKQKLITELESLIPSSPSDWDS